MATQNPDRKNSLYPEVIVSNLDASAPFLSNQNGNNNPSSSSSSHLYPTIDMSDLVENLFPEEKPDDSPHSPSAPPQAIEEVLIKISGAILNLIDKQYSVQLACGDFTVVRIRQGDNAVAVLARVANEIQWPLAKDGTAVKVDDSHYFFSFQVPEGHGNGSDSTDEEDTRKDDDLLSYGLTIASKGQESLLKNFDKILQDFSNFSVQKLSESAKKKGEVLDSSLVKEISPADLKSGKNKEMMEKRCAA